MQGIRNERVAVQINCSEKIKRIKSTLRSFIAIELPEKIHAFLADMQQDFKKCGADIRWVNTRNIHLTLKFLGSIEEKTSKKIIDEIKSICSHYRPFDLTIKGVGMFPNVKSPRVLWVGVNGSNVLTELKKDIEDGMSSLGFESEDRKFTPHLTLGRFRSGKGKECIRELMERYGDSTLGTTSVHFVSFMRSDLHPKGARYTKMSEAPLTAPVARI
jgi:2'-5' RNA ligase